jgi:hypothetical protein
LRMKGKSRLISPIALGNDDLVVVWWHHMSFKEDGLGLLAFPKRRAS